MAVSFQTGAEPIPGYKLLDRLGSGGFGEVWRCEAPGGIFKAVKVIHGDLRYKDTDSYRFAEQEMKSLMRVKTVRHPYLLALDRFDVVDGRLVIVMEMADCNLWDRFRECRASGLPGIPRDELLRYMIEAAEVLDLMYDKHQLQHLDIKPQNLFLLYNHVKVADFGQVKDLELHVAQVTGGITPVYAAPETFDGYVSRYCDQYSLACVYQELLTGVRPFDGTSMNQLLMQHLQQPPNLNPSPPADRPALARALAKKGDDRFPSVTAMVNAIRDGVRVTATVPAEVPVTATAGEPVAAAAPPPALAHPGKTGYAGPSYELHSPPPESTPFPRATADTAVPLERSAPPERTGSGPLRPAVVIGIGYTGRRVLQRFVRVVGDQFGAGKRVPLVRTVYIDTDPDSIARAVDPPAGGGLAPLPEESVVPAPLNRAAYYLRPRNNGRALIEGWFDPSVLYRLPRSPVTTGLRSLGRLALCDHFRAMMLKIQAEIDAVLSAEAEEAARSATGLDVRTNRPRVYLVAGLGGGTGSGMVIDLAYAIRHRLRRIGYSAPDVVGVLLAPPSDPNVSAQARANTFAALTELNHFSRPDSTFFAGYDEQSWLVRDNEPPFTRTFLLPGYDYADSQPVHQTSLPGGRRPRGGSGVFRDGFRAAGDGLSGERDSTVAVGMAGTQRIPAESAIERDPAAPVAEFLRLDLFSPIGRAVDAARDKMPDPGIPTIGTFGLTQFGWPRAEVVDRTARVIAPVLLGHWVDPDQAHVRDVVPRWTQEQWQRLGLNPDRLTARLKQAADTAVGSPVDDLIRETIAPISPKGWLARLPEPQAVAAAVDRFVAMFGPPHDTRTRLPTRLEEGVADEARAVADAVAADLMVMVPALLDTQAFRLAGTEEVVRQLLITLQHARQQVADLVGPNEPSAAAAYDRLAQYVYPQKGVKKLTADELSAALRDYPTECYQALIGRRIEWVYAHVAEVLTGRLNELMGCRQRIREHHLHAATGADRPADVPPPNTLLPVGCATVEEAARKFLKVLTDDDLNEIEQRLQARITEKVGGVFELCLNSAEGPEAMLGMVYEVTRDYLNQRMGEVDLAGMMKSRYRSTEAVGRTLAQALSAAEPTLVGRGPWANPGVTAFAAPGGAGGRPIAQQVVTLLPPEACVETIPDEVVFYREYPQVPLSALDQFGPAWAAAYKAAPDLLQASPHSRLDITRWFSVDE